MVIVSQSRGRSCGQCGWRLREPKDCLGCQGVRRRRDAPHTPRNTGSVNRCRHRAVKRPGATHAVPLDAKDATDINNRSVKTDLQPWKASVALWGDFTTASWRQEDVPPEAPWPSKANQLRSGTLVGHQSRSRKRNRSATYRGRPVKRTQFNPLLGLLTPQEASVGVGQTPTSRRLRPPHISTDFIKTTYRLTFKARLPRLCDTGPTNDLFQLSYYLSVFGNRKSRKYSQNADFFPVRNVIVVDIHGIQKKQHSPSKSSCPFPSTLENGCDPPGADRFGHAVTNIHPTSEGLDPPKPSVRSCVSCIARPHCPDSKATAWLVRE